MTISDEEWPQYHDGYTAALKGNALRQNPYKNGTQSRSRWLWELGHEAATQYKKERMIRVAKLRLIMRRERANEMRT